MANHDDDLGFIPHNDDLGFIPSKNNKASNISYLESLLRGSAQGASAGFADELAGYGGVLGDKLGRAGVDEVEANDPKLQAKLDQIAANETPSNADIYRKSRDEERASNLAASNANPKAFLAGQVGGSLPTALFSPEAQGLKGLAAVADNAKIGAGIGALSGMGSSDADLTQGDVGGFAKDVGVNAAVGGALNASLGTLLSKLSPSSLEDTAALRAGKASGLTKPQMKNLLKAPTADKLAIQKLISSGVPEEEATKMVAEKGGNRALEHGSNLINENPFQDKSVVTAGATPEVILERSQDLAQKTGEEIGNIRNQLDSKYSIDNPDIRKDFFNPQDAITKIKELQDKYVKNGEVVPLYKEQYNKLQDAIDTVASYGNKPINFSEAGVLKSLISDAAYGQDGKLSDQLMGQVRSIINDGMENAADKVTQATQDPDLYQRYLQAKDLHRTAIDAINSSLGKTAGNLVNNDFGIGEYMAGIGGAMAHGSVGGLAAAGLHKVAKTYGNSVAASAAYAGANVGKALTKVPTELLKSSGESLIASGGQLEGRLGRVLIQAADRDDVGRNAVLFSALQNPSYRELLNKIVNHSDDTK